jgi:hypothetical protein
MVVASIFVSVVGRVFTETRGILGVDKSLLVKVGGRKAECAPL